MMTQRMMQGIANLPQKPGCYMFKDYASSIIYVGKAKNLKKRVSSYFHKNHTDPKTQIMLQNVHDFDTIVTDTETEAFVLENTLIKKHQPVYNINLKDSKTYAYIRSTEDAFPRLQVARKKQGKCFGPFVSAQERDHLLRLLRKVFKIRTCKRMPKRPCLRYHIGLCSGPCAGHISQEEYQANLQRAEEVLRGRTAELIGTLRDQMRSAAEKRCYEQAAMMRDQILALEYLNERQNVERHKQHDEDIINFVIAGRTVYLMLFHTRKGVLSKKQEFTFSYHEEFLSDFLVQYYSDNAVPREIILPHAIDPALEDFLSQKRDGPVRIVVPKRGEKRQLLALVKKNIEMSFFGDQEKVAALRHSLKLQSDPSVIECFDISHLSGTSMVGSMVQFRNGRPDKSNYRRFRIRGVDGIDDFQAIAEVVGRRYSRLKREDADMPDLVIIDGGKGQLHAALAALQQDGVKLPVIAIAKREEEIFVPGLKEPIRMKRADKALKYVQEIRDEAHRFAINYNRLLRKKEMVA